MTNKQINAEILATESQFVHLDVYQTHRDALEKQGYTVERIKTLHQNTPGELVKYKYWK